MHEDKNKNITGLYGYNTIILVQRGIKIFGIEFFKIIF